MVVRFATGSNVCIGHWNLWFIYMVDVHNDIYMLAEFQAISLLLVFHLLSLVISCPKNA